MTSEEDRAFGEARVTRLALGVRRVLIDSSPDLHKELAEDLRPIARGCVDEVSPGGSCGYCDNGWLSLAIRI